MDQPLKRLTIFLIYEIYEPDPILSKVIQTKFSKSEGWESKLAHDYDEALALSATEKPDVVLTELVLGD